MKLFAAKVNLVQLSRFDCCIGGKDSEIAMGQEPTSQKQPLLAVEVAVQLRDLSRPAIASISLVSTPPA